MKEEFYASLPLYAKILFTFAIVSVGFAICFFAYKKIYKPRLELQRRRAYMAGEEDSERFMDDVGSPMGGDPDEWAYGADDTHSHHHTPVRLKVGKMRHGRSRVPSGATSADASDADPRRFQFSPVPMEDGRDEHHRQHGKHEHGRHRHEGDVGESTHDAHFHNLLQKHDGSGHFGY